MTQTVFLMSEVFRQEGWSDYLESLGNVEFLDFTGLEGTSCYCSEDAMNEIWDTLTEADPQGRVRWIDTGDYHYLSAINYLSLEDTDNLILIDNHPDNFQYEDILSCGNWMTYIDRFKPLCASETHPAYLSVDLDILSPEYFRTNWDQGSMTLEELFNLIRAIAVTKGISDVDICGGLTRSKGAVEEDLELNFNTRKQLMEFLNKLL